MGPAVVVCGKAIKPIRVAINGCLAMKKLPRQYTGPGLLDMQVNGYAGFDFNGDPAGWSVRSLREVAAAMARRGVTASLPTLITDRAEKMIQRAKRYGELLAVEPATEAHMPKLHIEGPFISPATGPRGAHPQAHCTSPIEQPDLIDRLQEASGGRVGVVSLAPEVPGVIDLIGKLSRQGICVALAHTQATSSQIADAVAAGAKMSTHLGNGSHQMLPRLDNYVQAQLADDRLWASFIPDGHHLPMTTLKNFLRAKTPQRSILVTDAITAAEMGPGQHSLGEGYVNVSEHGRASRPGEENLAGSALTLDVGVINTYLHCDVTFEQAWAMASLHPAKVLGLPVPADITVEITETGFLRL